MNILKSMMLTMAFALWIGSMQAVPANSTVLPPFQAEYNKTQNMIQVTKAYPLIQKFYQAQLALLEARNSAQVALDTVAAACHSEIAQANELWSSARDMMAKSGSDQTSAQVQKIVAQRQKINQQAQKIYKQAQKALRAAQQPYNNALNLAQQTYQNTVNPILRNPSWFQQVGQYKENFSSLPSLITQANQQVTVANSAVSTATTAAAVINNPTQAYSTLSAQYYKCENTSGYNCPQIPENAAALQSQAVTNYENAQKKYNNAQSTYNSLVAQINANPLYPYLAQLMTNAPTLLPFPQFPQN